MGCERFRVQFPAPRKEVKIPKKILLLCAAPDSGHAQAARALTQTIEHGAGWAVVEENLAASSPFLGFLFVRLYKTVLSCWPAWWGYVHDNPRYFSLARFIEKLLFQWDVLKVEAILRRHDPDLVVCAHALPLRMLALAKGAGRDVPPLMGVVTDFQAHRYWASDQVDRYFASSERAAEDLKRHGVKEERILLTGIPLRRQFLEDRMEQAEIRRQLGLDTARFTVLVLGGSYGLMPWAEFLPSAEAMSAAADWQWIFVFGRDERALNRAQQELAATLWDKILLFGFRGDIPRLMAAGDLVITKAGALTASEALAMSLPMIIYRPIPGQEEGNACFLEEAGAAVRVDRVDEAVETACDLFLSKERLAALRQAARTLARPNAAADIVSAIKNHWT